MNSVGPNKPASRTDVSAYLFLLKVLLWLPLFYALWYWVLVKAMTPPAVWLSLQFLKALYPTVIDRFFTQDGFATLVTFWPVDKSAGGDGHALAFQINLLKYSFGVPLFLALAAATPRSGRFENMVFGSLILIIPLIWGAVFEVLKILAFDFSAQFMPVAQFSSLQLDALALGFQWGSLLLPLLSPVAVWLVFETRFIQSLLARR
jgi:hypothetical protein